MISSLAIAVISFVVLLAGVGALVWYFAMQRDQEEEQGAELPDCDPPVLQLR